MTMKVFILFSFIGIQFLVSSTEALNNCTRGFTEDSVMQQIEGNFNVQTSCNWSVEAPVDQMVELNFNITSLSTGSEIKFNFGDEVFVSVGIYSVTSTGRQLMMHMVSTVDLKFTATYRFVAPTTTTPPQKTTQIIPIKTTVPSKITATRVTTTMTTQMTTTKTTQMTTRNTTQTTTLKPCNSKSGTPCVFPFIYDKTRYETCTTVKNNGVAWCPTTLYPSGEAKTYEDCSEDCPTRGSIKPNKCKTKRGFECQFPFKYFGILHSKCVTLDSDKPWCAVSINSATNEVYQWAYCNPVCEVEPEYSGPDCVTVADQNCIIPFKYKGVEYTKCATVDNNGVKWCATSTYGRSKLAKDWNDCQANNTKC